MTQTKMQSTQSLLSIRQVLQEVIAMLTRIITGADSNPVSNPNYDQNKRDTKEVEISMPLKHLGNFWNSLNIPLVNCEVSLALTWSETCVITGQPNRGNSSTNATFKITDRKLNVPVVTLSSENDNKLLEQLKAGFKITIKWSKYRSEMPNQTKNSNLNYLIDPTFTNVNRLFALTFENEDNRTSFSKYYLPNMLIDGKPFFEIPVKNKEEAYEAIVEMSKNNYLLKNSLLNYQYFKDHYKLIAIDLSKQIELENPDLKQQINFIGRSEENNATMFFIIEKKEETTFNFSQNSVTVS